MAGGKSDQSSKDEIAGGMSEAGPRHRPRKPTENMSEAGSGVPTGPSGARRAARPPAPRPRMWSETPGKLWKVGETAEGGARENPAFPPFFRLAVASIRRCCTCVPGVFDQMPVRGRVPRMTLDGERGGAMVAVRREAMR